jgi:hypothetical protein
MRMVAAARAERHMRMGAAALHAGLAHGGSSTLRQTYVLGGSSACTQDLRMAAAARAGRHMRNLAAAHAGMECAHVHFLDMGARQDRCAVESVQQQHTCARAVTLCVSILSALLCFVGMQQFGLQAAVGSTAWLLC